MELGPERGPSRSSYCLGLGPSAGPSRPRGLGPSAGPSRPPSYPPGNNHSLQLLMLRTRTTRS